MLRPATFIHIYAAINSELNTLSFEQLSLEHFTAKAKTICKTAIFKNHSMTRYFMLKWIAVQSITNRPGCPPASSHTSNLSIRCNLSLRNLSDNLINPAVKIHLKSPNVQV